MRKLINIITESQRGHKGAKYDRDLDVKEIAKLIRQDIKDALASGDLPKGFKCRVNLRRSSMSAAIDVTVTALPEDFVLLSQPYASWRKQFPDSNPNNRFSYDKMMSDQTNELMSKLKEIHGSYNYDNSDAMTDYFDVNYYGSVEIDYDLKNQISKRDIEAAPDDYWAEDQG